MTSVIMLAKMQSEVVLYIQKMERKRNFIGLIISVKPTRVMISVLCSRLLKEGFSSSKTKRLPDLIIIDGGATHLKQVHLKLKQLELNSINLISISKGVRRKSAFDVIHLQDGKKLTIDSNLSSTYHSIQEIRDETHRFAITLQKKKARKFTTKSSIDNLSGIGKVRKNSLIRYFGSIEQLKRASVDDLTEVTSIGKKYG